MGLRTRFYTTHTLIARMGPHPRPKPRLALQTEVDLTEKDWCTIKPAELRRVADQIGCPHGVKQLVWEMKRERTFRKARQKSEGRQPLVPDGDEEQNADDSPNELAHCSSCGAPASSTHTCTKCGRHNHPWCEGNIEAEGMHMNCLLVVRALTIITIFIELPGCVCSCGPPFGILA